MESRTRKRNTRHAIQAASAVFLVALGVGGTAADAGPRRQPPELMTTDAARAAVRLPSHPTVLRSRPVRVLRERLRGLDPRGDRSLRLSFFPDASFEIDLREKKSHSPTRYTWLGDLTGDDGSVIVSVNGDTVLVNLWSSRGTYELTLAPGGGAIARQLDPSAFPSCDSDGGESVPPSAAPAAEYDAATADAGCLEDGSVIDMLVVYTEEAKDNYAGGTTAEFETLIQLMEASVNLAWANSNIASQLRVVGTLEVDYAESGNSSTDRSRLQNDSDGFMDEVHPLRDALAADVVSLIVNDIENCGRAYFAIGSGNTPFPHLGFNVVQRSCTVGNLSFAHELGHNQGSKHDTDSSQVPFPYSHGYNEGNIFRTVMAVCCSPTRINHFSNPDVLYFGLPTGVAATADNARSMDETAQNVANFRCTIPDCSDGIDNDMDGGIDVAGDLGCDSPGDYSERSDAFVCDDGNDNDGDGLTDYPFDPGCAFAISNIEDPQCNDGDDNDMDGDIDLADANCASSADNSEKRMGCGFGFELALLLPGLLGLRRRRRGGVR